MNTLPSARVHLSGYALALMLLVPAGAQAHSFGRVLALPMPLWLYIYGSTAALVLSFAVLAMSPESRWRAAANIGGMNSGVQPNAAPLVVQAAIGAAFTLAVVAGMLGTPNPYRNFSMTFFWVAFVLGGYYLCAVFGDVAMALNPWHALLTRWPSSRRAFDTTSLFHAPALALYMGFIAFELFGPGTPHSLAWALLGYTGITMAGSLLVGAERWLEHGEFFSLLFRIAARMSPLEWRSSSTGRRGFAWRSSIASLVSAEAPDFGVALFILFMIASTTFDGLKETVAWNALYWQKLAPLMAPLVGSNIARAYPTLSALQTVLNAVALLFSPLVYLAACSIALKLSLRLEGRPHRYRPSLGAAILAFVPSLIPIAIAYNAAHYFTLLLGQGPQLAPLLADPFGWRLGATAMRVALPSPTVAWHIDVGLIVGGHVLSMIAWHRRASREANDAARGPLAQVPMLLLMMLLTASGLWVLAQPVSPSRLL
ncbi:hypothetical protein VSR68_39730 [Paraburkholderia phymatum]|uniref:hypothetical protein n=1 Tax=Paraburkholderia phymatum TaxID=148447 RepID=UPI00318287FB